MSSEVPFKDFLFYLYHSATPSPASTREGSISRGHRNSNAPFSLEHVHHKELGKSLQKIKSQSYSDLAVRTTGSENVVGGGGRSGGRNHVGVVIHHGMSSNPSSKKSGHSNNKVDVSTKDANSTNTISLNSINNSQSQRKTNASPTRRDSKYANAAFNMKQRKSVIQKSALLPLVAQPLSPPFSPTPQPQSQTKLQDRSKSNKSVKNVKELETNGEQSRNRSRASYRESLGDNSQFFATNSEKNNDSISKATNNKSNNKFAYNDDAHIHVQSPDYDPNNYEYTGHEAQDSGLHHLCVNEAHDLSFFKNFSATTRSKSSLAACIVAQSQSKDGNQCVVQHVYDFSNQAHNDQEISSHYNLSNRLSRSTPIALDAITSATNNKHRCKDDHHYLFLPEIDQTQLFKNQIKHSQTSYLRDEESHSPTNHHHKHFVHNDEKETSPTRSTADVQNYVGNVGHSFQQDLHSEKGNNLDMRKLRNSSVDMGQPVKKSQFVHNSKSSPALNDNNEIQTDARINTLNAVVPVSSNKSASNGSTTTTVTVKMDNASLFLDTVYVNLRQDIDSAASIKLFY